MARLIEDVVLPQEIIGFVRKVLEADRWRFALEQFLPNTRRTSPEFQFTRADYTDYDSAKYRQWDTEAPIDKRKGFTRLSGSIAPISSKIPLGEELKLRLEQQTTGDISTLRDQIYNDIANRVRSVSVRIERARGEMLETAKLTLNENGVVGTIDTGRDSSMSFTASPLWSSHSTSDPITDLTTWIRAYYDLNFVLPGQIIVSYETMQHLLLNDKIRTTASSLIGAPSILSNDRLAATLGAQGIPPLFLYEGRARVDGTQTRIISSNKIIFLPPAGEPLGETQFIPTAESLAYAGKDFMTIQQAADVTASVWTEEDPPISWTKASANVVPFLANPNLAAVATVA